MPSAVERLKELVQAVIDYKGQRRVIARQYSFPLLRRLTPVVAAPHAHDEGLWYFVSTADDAGRHIFSRGGDERDLLEHALTVVRELRGHDDVLRGRTFVDVGAHIGTSTIPAIRVFGARQALVFEPDPSNFRLLRANLASSKVDRKVRAFPIGLSDRPGTGSLALSSSNGADHRVRSSTAATVADSDEEERRRIEIPLERLEDVWSREDVDLADVGLVWIDVQGHEGQVLAGAPSLVESRVPVVTEYWPYGLRLSGGLDLFHEIVATNYRFVDLRRSVLGRAVECPGSDVARLADIYRGTDYTDLLLVK